MSSAVFYSRELSHLQKAKDDLTALPTCHQVTPDNVLACAGAICDPLLKFTSSWSNQQGVYESRRNATLPYRIIFGDHDRSNPGFRSVGLIPILSILAVLSFIAAIFIKFMQRHGFWQTAKMRASPPKPAPPNDLQMTLLLIIGAIATLLVCLGLSWTFGMLARHESQGTDSALRNDSEKGSGKIYNDSTFGKIWQACNTKLLRKLYNCRQGLGQMDGVPKATLEEAGGEAEQEAINNAKCNGLDPKLFAADAAERAVLATGLNALKAANIAAFDATALLQVINEEINKLRSMLSPKGAAGTYLSALEAQKIIEEQVLPVLKQPAYKPQDPLDPRSCKLAALAFQEAIALTFIPKIEPLILQYWPLLNPEMYVDVIDDRLTAYYDAKGNAYYSEYLRDHVLATIRMAVNAVSLSLQGLDARYASITQFISVNWGMIRPMNISVAAGLQRLRDAVSVYVDTFVVSSSTKQSLSYELSTMYINHTIGIIVLGLVAGLIYYLFIRKLDLWSPKNATSTADAWYSYMDLFKYALVMITVAMFIIAMLVAIKTKRTSTAEHNANAQHVNTMKLKMSIQALSAPETLSDPNAFYTRSIQVLEAYERCNNISRSSKVPFPTVEFIILLIFAMVCISCLAYITMSTGPRTRINEIRNLMRLREKLSLFTSSSLPAALKGELDTFIGCTENKEVDVLRILAFVFAIILFILNAIIVSSFRRSASDYTRALDSLAADVCV